MAVFPEKEPDLFYLSSVFLTLYDIVVYIIIFYFKQDTSFILWYYFNMDSANIINRCYSASEMQTAHMCTIFLWPSCLNRWLTLSLWFPHGCLVMGDQCGTLRTRESIFWPVIFIRLHQRFHDYNQQATFLSWASAPHKNKCEFEMSNAWKSSHMHLNGISIEKDFIDPWGIIYSETDADFTSHRICIYFWNLWNTQLSKRMDVSYFTGALKCFSQLTDGESPKIKPVFVQVRKVPSIKSNQRREKHCQLLHLCKWNDVKIVKCSLCQLS